MQIDHKMESYLIPKYSGHFHVIILQKLCLLIVSEKVVFVRKIVVYTSASTSTPRQ
jgi:hypothetical protein